MPYIGRDTDKLSNVEVLDTITFDGSQSYTLQKGGVNFTPSSANNILISIDGVVQANNFTCSSSTIDFGVAIASSSTCDFILHYGVGLITTPADGTITNAKLAASAINSQTAETSIAGGDEVLIYDTSASALRKMTRTNFVSGIGGTNTPSWLAHNNSGDTISTATYVKVELDTVVHDTASGFDTTNDKYTIPSGQGGYYQLYGVVNARNTSNQIKTVQTIFYKNGSALSNKYAKTSVNNTDSGSGIFRGFSNTLTTTVNLSAGDYLEMYTYIDVTSGSAIVDEISYFGGNKLIT